VDLTTLQPAPVPTDGPSVQSMVCEDLRFIGGLGPVGLVRLVGEDLVTRERIGVERYGTSLKPHNGRDALRDAYEEAVDLAIYLRQAIAEGMTLSWPRYTVALHMVCDLRGDLLRRDGQA
jgi:hypothetical protein